MDERLLRIANDILDEYYETNVLNTKLLKYLDLDYNDVKLIREYLDYCIKEWYQYHSFLYSLNTYNGVIKNETKDLVTIIYYICDWVFKPFYLCMVRWAYFLSTF